MPAPCDSTPFKDAVEGDEGGVEGVITPWVILGRGSLSPGSISALRVTGDPAKGDPGGGAPPPHPPPTASRTSSIPTRARSSLARPSPACSPPTALRSAWTVKGLFITFNSILERGRKVLA